jgi:hypothetical protein
MTTLINLGESIYSIYKMYQINVNSITETINNLHRGILTAIAPVAVGAKIELKEFEGAGSFEVPVYPVRTLIIIFSGICCLIYLQLIYHTVTGKIAPKKG